MGCDKRTTTEYEDDNEDDDNNDDDDDIEYHNVAFFFFLGINHTFKNPLSRFIGNILNKLMKAEVERIM